MAAKKRATKGRNVRKSSGPFFTSPSRSAFREPPVTLGEPMSFPDTRAAILEKIIAYLDSEGPFRQEFSNGEFITTSYAVARTFEECKAVEALEAPGYAAHYDAKLNIYWRRTGSFG